nr:integumentary mucin C.1-like [Cherax quadricarinatus]
MWRHLQVLMLLSVVVFAAALNTTPPVCRNNTSCLKTGGQCQTSCLPPKRVIPNTCRKSCKCCADACNTTLCTAAKGYCIPNNELCIDGKIKLNLCQGYNCGYCCIPNPCPTPKSCKKYQGGYCNTSCNANERPIPGYCTANCTCCAKTCKPSNQCTRANGNCTYPSDCAGITKLGLCKGFGCVCCLHGTTTTKTSVKTTSTTKTTKTATIPTTTATPSTATATTTATPTTATTTATPTTATTTATTPPTTISAATTTAASAATTTAASAATTTAATTTAATTTVATTAATTTGTRST